MEARVVMCGWNDKKEGGKTPEEYQPHTLPEQQRCDEENEELEETHNGWEGHPAQSDGGPQRSRHVWPGERAHAPAASVPSSQMGLHPPGVLHTHGGRLEDDEAEEGGKDDDEAEEEGGKDDDEEDGGGADVVDDEDCPGSEHTQALPFH